MLNEHVVETRQLEVLDERACTVYTSGAWWQAHGTSGETVSALRSHELVVIYDSLKTLAYFLNDDTLIFTDT